MRRPETGRGWGLTRLAWALALWPGCSGAAEEPTAPVEAMLRALREGDAEALSRVCDPEGGLDGDARRVCSASPADAASWAQLRAWLGAAKVVGLVPVGPNEARVDVEMGPDGRRVAMTVVERDGRWYLRSF